MEHTKEPWKVDNNEFPAVGSVLDLDGEQVCQTSERRDSIGVKNQLTKREANARRIVLCVNACEGIEDNVLSGARLGIDGFKARIEHLEKQRDCLISALEEIISFPYYSYGDNEAACEMVGIAEKAKIEASK